jgi:putative transposase
MNKKRTRRLGRDEGLRRPAPCKRKRTRPPGGAERFRAERANHVWAIDFQFDETADYRRIKLFNIVDEHTREALAMRVGRRCDADQVVSVIEALVAERGAPQHLRMDNGPELIAWALRDWCRLAGTNTRYIEPGSPWKNPFVESFNGRVRDELLNIEEFTSLLEAQTLIEPGASSTTRTDPTRPSVASLPPSSPPDAKNQTHVRRSTTISATITPDTGPTRQAHSHNNWTDYRGPVTATASKRRIVSHARATGVPIAELTNTSATAPTYLGVRRSVWAPRTSPSRKRWPPHG